jgi:pimeloyl-ACP methyl ester carboxylesterase
LQAFLLVAVVFCAAWQLYAESPTDSSVSTPSAVNSNAIEGGSIEEFTIFAKESANSDKKIARKAQLVRYDNAEATVVICHGFMCDKHDVAFLRRLFPRGKYNVLTFDFRGHGEDRGPQACTFGRDEVYDIEAAVQHVKNHADLKDMPCIAYGFSMGAASAIESQARNQSLFDAMILDCPFDSSENVVKRGLDGLKVSAFGYEFNLPGRSLLQKYAFHPHVQAFVKNVLRCITALDPRNININMCRVYPGESVRKISVPCFFIHCKNDEKIGVESVKNIYNNAACGYKKLWITGGRHHFDSYFYAPERYTSEVRQFLSQVLDGTAKQTEYKQIVEE